MTTNNSVLHRNEGATDAIFARSATSLVEENDGTWIGIDVGTSHCSAAVWDSAGGRAKWMRLGRNGLARKQHNGKTGRLVPSAVLLASSSDDVDKGTGIHPDDFISTNRETSSSLCAHVGQVAMNMLDQSLEASQSLHDDNNHKIHNPDEITEALVTSIKRVLGMSFQQIQQIDAFRESLPFSIIHPAGANDDDDVNVRVKPLGSCETLSISALAITSTLIRSIRLAAQEYLERNRTPKHLQVPGASTRVRNCVVGVPAHFGQTQRHLMEQACRMAGFDGHVSTLTESTAGSMAYGLFVSSPGPEGKTILVFDMGGGTTDVTLASMSSRNECNDGDRQFQVIVTEGDPRLGGDDMDECILRLVLEKWKLRVQHKGDNTTLNARKQRLLLRSCRRAKELLCGGGGQQGSFDPPPLPSTEVVFEGVCIEITNAEFRKSIEPLMQRARLLLKKALDQYGKTTTGRQHPSVDEVVLVGGATRVPAVRDMLKSVFPPPLELCTSINADAAVAQGLAIEAAIRSNKVPKHELRSALMLDALPHSIGVQIQHGGAGGYVPILPKDSSLPAKGYATFTLADIDQPGVTVVAVEDVGDNLPFEKIGEFTFLLHRLSEEERAKLPDGKRHVDIGMDMEPNGQFVVSVFDPNDPEHVRKRRRYRLLCGQKGTELGYHDHDDGAAKDLVTMEQALLFGACALVFVLYVAVKLAFHEPEPGTSSSIV